MNMDFLEKIKAFLVSIIALLLPRSEPPVLSIVDLESHQQPTLPSLPPSDNDPETLQPESPPPSTINQFDFESSQPPTQPSPPPSANDPETLQPESPPTMNQLESSQQPIQPSPTPSSNDPETLRPHTPLPTSSAFNIELLQPPFPTNQPESSQPLPPTPTTPSNLKQLESILAAQQHLQWKNSVLSFCFSYAIAVSLQCAQTDHQANEPNFSLVFLSFLVLLTFNLFLLALFIRQSCTKTSEILEKVAFLVAAAAFCHATAIPFPFELKCAVWAVFLLTLLLVTIFIYLNRNTA